MSKTRIGTAVIVLTILLSSTAVARVHLGGGPFGVASFAVARALSIGGVHRSNAYAHRGRIRAVQRSRDVRSAGVSGLGNPAVRSQITAAAALAGWHGGGTARGWWQHADGGYGWVGPLFWPFAIHDMTDYAIWGDGIGFWNYGHRDISAAIFAPYRREDLAFYTSAEPSSRRHRRDTAINFCGDNSSTMAGLPLDRLQQVIQPSNEAQRAALDDLANALAAAAQLIRASCPAQPAFTAPERLAVMQQRIEAMIKVRFVVQQPLGKFYDLLDDEQEARLNAVAEEQRKMSAGRGATEASAQGCDAALQWPANEIEARLRPNDSQRAALRAFQEANANAAGLLSAHCQPQDATTPPARLDAVQGRLEAMMQAVGLVSAALNDLYPTLNNEQKAQFEAIGQKRKA